MTDDYAQRKVQVIRDFLAAGYPAPYTVEAVVPRRDPLADTKFKIILNNQVERTLAGKESLRRRRQPPCLNVWEF